MSDAVNQDLIWDHFQNDGVESFAGARPRLEFIVRQIRRGDRALNVGVGSGELEALALGRGIEIWSLDPNARAIESLRSRLGVGDRAQQGYGQQMPFPDDHFDAVVMSEVLEHLDAEIREQTLVEVRRVLRPGGHLLGTVPAREQLSASEVVCPSCGHHFHRWGHQASFDVVSMKKLLSRHLSVDRIEELYINEWASAGWVRRAGGLIKKFLSWRGLGPYSIARNIFFVARKSA